MLLDCAFPVADLTLYLYNNVFTTVSIIALLIFTSLHGRVYVTLFIIVTVVLVLHVYLSLLLFDYSV